VSLADAYRQPGHLPTTLMLPQVHWSDERDRGAVLVSTLGQLEQHVAVGSRRAHQQPSLFAAQFGRASSQARTALNAAALARGADRGRVVPGPGGIAPQPAARRARRSCPSGFNSRMPSLEHLS
jgi:hypothetical protein